MIGWRESAFKRLYHSFVKTPDPDRVQFTVCVFPSPLILCKEASATHGTTKVILCIPPTHCHCPW